MIGVYFSGTGNTRYCVERFMKESGLGGSAVSIEDSGAAEKIAAEDIIVFGYPTQYSNLPKIVRDFINKNASVWQGKKVFVIVTMGLFCGDGAGVMARLLKKHGAEVVGGLHLKMPDSICDEKALKRTDEENIRLISAAEEKIRASAAALKNNDPTSDGIGLLPHLAGLFGQRLYFYNKPRRYFKHVRINAEKCVGCGKCAKLCPLQNITISEKCVVAGDRCTMCYRCANECPKQAITLFGRRVVQQNNLDKLLKK